MANTRVAVVYTDKNGVEYLYTLNGEIVSQTVGDPAVPKVGGRLAAGADKDLPRMPRQMTPRRALMTHATGRDRYVALLSNDAELITNPDATLNIEDSDGASLSYTRHDWYDERVRRPRVA